LNTTDIIILIALFLPALIGAIYGFLNIVFSILAWVLALGMSAKFGSYFSPLIEEYIQTDMLRDALAFVGLFVVSLMIFTAIGYFIVKLMGKAGLTATDRILGFFLGFGLGISIVAVVVFLAGFTAITEEAWWQSSMILETFEQISVWAQQFLPDNVAKYHSYAE